MLEVNVKTSGGIEKALKDMKRKVKQTKLVNELKSRKQFTKKSVKRRAEILSAIYKRKFGEDK
jgi:small subunit ribosomal protein S21